VLFLKDEIKMEDVYEIKKSAYLKETHKKTIVIAAEKFNVYAQNALLKILEESPDNVEFILIGPSKYVFLDTVLSRLVLEKRFFEETIEEKDIKNITNDMIFELLNSEIDTKEMKSILKSLLKKAANEEQLKIINDALLMLELNIDKKAVLAMVMLAFKERK
jgi:DNA polymerase-3 subunit delta'